VKHESHTPTCAFKVPGGIVYMDNLKCSRAKVTGVISATLGIMVRPDVTHVRLRL
jgi:threonine dehydratase